MKFINPKYNTGDDAVPYMDRGSDDSTAFIWKARYPRRHDMKDNVGFDFSFIFDHSMYSNKNPNLTVEDMDEMMAKIFGISVANVRVHRPNSSGMIIDVVVRDAPPPQLLLPPGEESEDK